MIITKTPLRISLLGGNSDMPGYFKKYGGAVLTTTIDKYVYCIVKERFDKEIRVNYSIKEIVTNIKDIKHDLVREAMKLVGVTEGVEITFLSDIPSEGSGLGSSSAVVVGLLNALHHYKNEPVTARQLAEEACHIEVDVLKKSIGYQDQYAVAFGGSNLILFSKKITITKDFSTDHSNLMLFYTGITRNADKILSKMKLNKRILDKNKALVFSTKPLEKSMNEYWELKKKLNPLVTTPYLNKLYKKAIDLGADAGKIVGAGGGGFLLLSVKPGNQDYLRDNLGLQELKFNISKYGSQIIFSI